jgi:hypothetical protein
LILIRNVKLYDYYQKAYQIYIKKEQEFVEKEIRREILIRWLSFSEYQLAITADRLSEEGISSVQQLALINPNELEERTKFPLQYIIDWKDQAVLYLLTGDRVVSEGTSTRKNNTLYDKLGENLGIRTMSSLLKLWGAIKKNDIDNLKEQCLYKSLALMGDDKKDFIQLQYLFTNIIATSEFYFKQSKALQNHD